jgi:hypothetical protein
MVSSKTSIMCKCQFWNKSISNPIFNSQ